MFTAFSHTILLKYYLKPVCDQPRLPCQETEDDDKQEAEVGTDQEDEEGKKRKHHNVSARTGEDTLAQVLQQQP